MSGKLGGESFAKKIARRPIGTVSFDQLMNMDVKQKDGGAEKKKEWNALVSQVKELIGGLHPDRILIADIALRACYVIHGGDVRSEAFRELHQPHTLRKFAIETGINIKTLYNWTAVKRYVFDHLTEEEKKDFKYTVAANVFVDVRKKTGSGWGDKGESFTEQMTAAYRQETHPDYLLAARRRRTIRNALSNLRWWLQGRLSYTTTLEEIRDLRAKLSDLMKLCDYRIDSQAEKIKPVRVKKKRPAGA